ncbi:hypothetical protein [Streptomyces umbrinus]|uniref:hypothetical protein n=1 Tax=Streptomyces umbrinus TaxID=67370 RepID=UPI003422F654
MALRVETVQALAVVQSGAFSSHMYDARRKLMVPGEVATLFVALAEEVARLDARVKELEETA